MPFSNLPTRIQPAEITRYEKKDGDLILLLSTLRSAKQRSSSILRNSLIETARTAYQASKAQQPELTVY